MAIRKSELYSIFNPEMGDETWRQSVSLFPTAHEDQVGQLQPPGRAHSVEHRIGKETKGFGGVRSGPRDGPSYGADP